jgi:ubiquinone/menaquinone biosynthesis C-methylase UbiE
MSAPGYDRLAGCYRLLETLAFGRALERARFRHFDHLHNRKRILLLGDGDGRGLALALRIAPHAQIDSLDSSAGMLTRASRRLSPEELTRVTFLHADAFAASYPAETYDAVTTLFFLDCFSGEQVERLIERLRPALTKDALWLHADFALPPAGWARLRARVWLTIMFWFFRWQTGRPATQALPPAETLFESAGFVPLAHASWQHGFLVSTLFRQSSLSLNK